MRISFSGHRSDKLYGTWTIPNPKYNQLSWKLKEILENQLKPDECMSGMAQGWDFLCANVCTQLAIPWIAAVPFLGQEKAWPQEAQERYRRLLNKAKEVIVVSPGPYHVSKLQVRNEYMVDWLNDPEDLLLACWNGDNFGGTRNCIVYAEKQNKNIKILNPETLELNNHQY